MKNRTRLVYIGHRLRIVHLIKKLNGGRWKVLILTDNKEATVRDKDIYQIEKGLR